MDSVGHLGVGILSSSCPMLCAVCCHHLSGKTLSSAQTIHCLRKMLEVPEMKAVSLEFDRKQSDC